MTQTPTTYHSARSATVIIAVVLVGVVIWWLRGILAPFALALFLMVMIDALARVMHRRIPGFPERAAEPVALVFTTLVFGVLAYVAADNARGFVTQLIAYTPKFNDLIAQVGARFGMEVPPTVGKLFANLDLPHFLSSVVAGLRSFASAAGLVLVYLIFLLISREGFAQKGHRLFRTPKERDNAVKIFIRIRTGVERYIWVQTLVAAIIAGASWAIMAIVGLNNSLFWAFLIFVASYVPILGGAVGILLPPIFALVQFGADLRVLGLLVGAEAVHIVVGNFVAPRMQGISLNVDPIVVVLSLAFWGAVWGVPGMFLSTPLTVVAIVVLVQFPGTRWLAILLSRDGAPEAYGDGSADPSEPAKPGRTRARVTQA